MDRYDILKTHHIAKWEESERLEFKTSTREYKEIVQTVVAFANTQGGIVVVGVADNGEVVGQDISDATIREITNTLLANINERAYPSVQRHEIEGKSVLVVVQDSSPLSPHYAYGRAYKRVGTSNVVLTASEYNLMLTKKLNGGGADRDMLPECQIGDIQQEKIDKFIKLANERRNLNYSLIFDKHDVLQSLELLNAGILTKGACYLFGNEPKKFVQNAEFRVAHFKDEERKIFLDQRVFEGDLFTLFEKVISFYQDRSSLKVNTKKIASGTYRDIPTELIKELVLNAIVHRDYRDNSPSYLNIIGEDYIEIKNPGSLPPPLTPDNIFLSHTSHPINRRITKVFFLAGMIERWGEGTSRVYNECLKLGLPEPKWECGNGIVRVVVRMK